MLRNALIWSSACRDWRSAAEFWAGPMQNAAERAVQVARQAVLSGQAVQPAEQAVQAAALTAPLEGVRQFLVTRQATTCASSPSSSCTQPAVVSTVRPFLQALS